MVSRRKDKILNLAFKALLRSDISLSFQLSSLVFFQLNSHQTEHFAILDVSSALLLLEVLLCLHSFSAQYCPFILLLFHLPGPVQGKPCL